MYRAHVLSLLVLIISQVTAAESGCLLCGDEGVNALKRPYFIADRIGTTCAEVMVKLSLTTNCPGDLAKYQKLCCDDEEPAPIPQIFQASATPSTQLAPDAKYPACNICYNGNKPGDTSMVINMLKLPQAPNTCTFFYYFGLQGHIPKELCDTLQFFAFEPCGCADDPAGAPPADDSGNSGNERRERKPVDPEYEAKEANKMSNGYGGAGGQYHSGRRGLKGAPLLPYKKQGSAK